MTRQTYRGKVGKWVALVEWFPEREVARVSWGGKGRPDGPGSSVREVPDVREPVQRFLFVDDELLPAAGSANPTAQNQAPQERAAKAPAIWRTVAVAAPSTPSQIGAPRRGIAAWLSRILGFVLGSALIVGVLGAFAGVARFAAEPGAGPSEAPAVVWTPPGGTDVVTTTGPQVLSTGCSASQEWRWADTTGRRWHAMARDCGDPENATRWAAQFAPRNRLDAAFGFATPPMAPGRTQDGVASFWSQGSLWLRISHPLDTGPASISSVARSLAAAVGQPVNPNPDRYPIALVSTLAFVLLLGFHFTGRRWQATRGAIQGIVSAHDDLPPDQPRNYENVDKVAPISRIAIRLQQYADLAVLVLAMVLGVIAVRLWLMGGGWLSAVCVVVFVFAFRGVMRVVSFTQGSAFAPLMPMPIESTNDRAIVLVGKSLRVGVNVALYALIGILGLMLAELWLSVPAPRGLMLLAMNTGATDLSGLWRVARSCAEAIVAFAPLFGLLLLLGVWLGLGTLWRLSERWSTIYAHERVAIPDFPPMLYLRSFDEDALLTDQGDLAQGWAERLLARRRVRFEELMTRAAATLAPVDAVIDPRSAALTIGAARIVPSGHWQDSVREHAERALCVIVSATPDTVGEGFGWELELLGRSLGHSRLCFIIGPWPLLERQRRLRAFLERANREGALQGLTLEMIPTTTHIVAGSSSGDWVMAGSTRSDAFSYAMSLLSALASFAEPWAKEAAVPTVPMSRQRRESLLLTQEPPDVPWRFARALMWVYRTFPFLGRASGYYDD